MQRRLYQETNQRLVESQSLQRLTAALLQRLTLGEVLEVICAEAQRLTGHRGDHTVAPVTFLPDSAC